MSDYEIYALLDSLLNQTYKYFKTSNTENSKAFVNILTSLKNNSKNIRPIACDVIEKKAHLYDVSPDIKANGYRSLLKLTGALLHGIIQTLQNINREKGDRFFRSNFYVDKLGTKAEVLHQLRFLIIYAKILMEYTENGDIFVDVDQSKDMMHDCALMCKACFYGDTQGFQFYSSIQPIIQAMALFTASYNDVREQSTLWRTATSAFKSGKYLVSPGTRGDKIDKIFSNCDIKFFKEFWSLPEKLPAQVNNLISQNVEINKSFVLPSELLTLHDDNGEVIEIFRSSSLNKKNKVTCRLISHALYQGQTDPKSPAFTKARTGSRGLPKSKYLIFFIHGGGFVALTSKSYEPVLREWSKEIECPILSVDYSLAPEAPFPEAFEECFYAYAWALTRAHYLGTTAEKVIFVGDSAGGNLVLSTALRAATYRIQMPHAILPLYPAAAVQFSGSPSRLLSILDPLLPTCLLTSCLTSYSGFKTEHIEYSQDELSTDAVDCPMQENKDRKTTSKITTFFNDIGNGFKSMTTSASADNLCTASHHQNWWDETYGTYGEEDFVLDEDSEKEIAHSSKFTLSDAGFEVLDVDRNDNKVPHAHGEILHSVSDFTLSGDHTISRNDTGADFRIKLPPGYKPYKSKHFNKTTTVYSTPLSQNPYMSPALASDEMLKTLPFMDIVACELDPLFDDSIHLVKRLVKLEIPHKFHIVRGLPHGFLNFQMCKEARDASKMCMRLIREYTIDGTNAYGSSVDHKHSLLASKH